MGCGCALRKEAREFLERQRATSDARVHAHKEVVTKTAPPSGQGAVLAEKGKKKQTTPPGGQGAVLAEKGKKKQTTPTGGKGATSSEKGKKKKREKESSRSQPTLTTKTLPTKNTAELAGMGYGYQSPSITEA